MCLLASFHDDFPDREGLSVEELRLMVFGGMDPKLMRLILDELAKGGTARTVEETVRLSPDRPLSSIFQDGDWLRRELESLYLDAALVPPSLREAMAHFPRQGPGVLRDVLDELAVDGILCEVNDDLYFHHDGLERLVELIVNYLHEQGETDIQGLKALTGMIWKFLIPVLEYLDEAGVTHRVDDTTRVRVLRAQMQIGEHAGQQGAKTVQKLKHH